MSNLLLSVTGPKAMQNTRLILSSIVTVSFLSAFSGANATTDSTSLAPSTYSVQPLQSIILQDLGYLPWADQAVSETHRFNTNYKCPSSYVPFVLIIPTKLGQYNNTALQSFGACLTVVSTVSWVNNYTVEYLTVRNYATFTQNFNTTTIKNLSTGAQGASAQFWTGTSNAVWGLGSTQEYRFDLPATSYLSGASPDYGNVGGLTWMLYCYPPTMPSPATVAQDFPFAGATFYTYPWEGCAAGNNPF